VSHIAHKEEFQYSLLVAVLGYYFIYLLHVYYMCYRWCCNLFAIKCL